MTRHRNAQALIDLAHRHLHVAATAAEQSAGDLVRAQALAGQIRLAAASLPPVVLDDDNDVPPLDDAHVVTHLREAVAALDQIPPFDGPPNLPLCAWHIHELSRIAARTGAA